MWCCDLYNFGVRHHFDTREQAEMYGKNSGFQFSVYRIEKTLCGWKKVY
jgi:hypothetical protein